MDDPNLRLVFVIMLGVFALIAAGTGVWLAKKAIDTKEEGAGLGALICAVITLTILGAAGKVAGLIDIFK